MVYAYVCIVSVWTSNWTLYKKTSQVAVNKTVTDMFERFVFNVKECKAFFFDVAAKINQKCQRALAKTKKYVCNIL